MAIAKVILNGETLMDVTSDTVTANNTLSGIKATKNDGTKITGNIASKSSSDLTASGATVTAPAGYYANAASKSVATTTHPNPTASITSSTGVITASHTQGTGYVTSGTTTGTLSLTTQASKTVTPTESAQTAVASYRWTTGPVNVAAISSTYVGTGVVRKSAADLTTSGSNVTAPAGYYSSAVSKAVAAGSAFPPAVTITKAPTISMVSSTGVITASYTGSSSVTPTVNAGYITAGTAGTISTTGTSTYNLTTQGAQTITPRSTAQTIASNRWLTGTQTIAGDSNLKAENIAEGVSIFGVTGTYGGGEFYYLLKALVENQLILSVGSSTKSYTSMDVSNYFNSLQSLSTKAFCGRNFSGTFTFANLLRVPNYCFADGTVLTDFIVTSTNKTFIINIPEVTDITTGAFGGNKRLSLCIAPKCTYIGEQAFAYCGFSSVSFPACTSISYGAFYKCSFLTEATFASSMNIIGSSAFYNCSQLLNVNILDCSIISDDAFGLCNKLSTTISFPNCIQVGSAAFAGCWSISTINLPHCTDIGSQAFQYCNHLTTVYLPLVSQCKYATFSGCYALTEIELPSCTIVSEYAFDKCSALTIVKLPICQSFREYVFRSCYNLISLYLNRVSAVPHYGTSMFYSTPISNYTTSAGRYGSIFVPASLFESFKTATNWTVYSARMVSV